MTRRKRISVAGAWSQRKAERVTTEEALEEGGRASFRGV